MPGLMVWLSDRAYEAVKKLSKETGLPVSKLISMAVEYYAEVKASGEAKEEERGD